jgi:hypothetical protein
MTSYKGTVQNGVVVLEPGAKLPEGAVVRVEVEAPPRATDEGLDPVWQMPELAVDTGIPDLAVNIDHYLYGHPKATDATKRLP